MRVDAFGGGYVRLITEELVARIDRNVGVAVPAHRSARAEGRARGIKVRVEDQPDPVTRERRRDIAIGSPARALDDHRIPGCRWWRGPAAGFQ